MAKVTLRALTPDDWEAFRVVRLRALGMHPNYFCSTVETTKARPVEYWHETLDGKGKAVFGLFDQDNLIGITGVFTWDEEPSGKTGLLGMSFIEPDYRGNGYSEMFYKARIEFAVSHMPWKKLGVFYREGNEPSRASVAKHGFQFVESKDRDWPDGKRDKEYMYELDLEKLRS